LTRLCYAQEQQSTLATADSEKLNFRQFGLLAIQDGGRRKPIDTFARETLIRITARSRYTDKAGRNWTPSDFLLSALLETHDWRNEPMVLVSYGMLKEQLGLDRAQRRFSFAQLTTMPELNRLANEAHALRKAERPLDRLQQEVMSVSERLALFAHVMDGSAFLIVPAPKSETDPWLIPPEFSRYYNETQFAPRQKELETLATAYMQGDSFQFSRAAKQLRDDLSALSPAIYPTENQLELEYGYNHFAGFYRAIWFYGLAFVILLVAHLRNRGNALRNVGVTIAVLGLGLHATGIVLRCLIAGRPPVTNMYESIIWVSFAVSFFGMIFFSRYRTPVYLLAALPVTLTALLLVHQMPIAMPSSIDPLVPVLRDNFWLTVHVLTITLSYAAFALAMGFGHILLFRYARNPSGARADAPMHFWLYRVLQLGVLLLAAGTILGGVRANYSWGRFWGWDPKENGAVLIVLWCAIILHARWGGFIRQRGLMIMAIFGNVVTSFSWFGVNMLGVGLHSYGFMQKAFPWLVGFIISQLALMCVASMPLERWRSFRATGATRSIKPQVDFVPPELAVKTTAE